MSNSVYIASMIGPVFLAISLSLLVNRSAFQGILKSVDDDALVILLAGIGLLVAGIAIVQTHDVWQGWPVIITLLGWLAIIGGLFRILFATRMQTFVDKMPNSTTVLTFAATVSLLLGLFLTGKGFGLI